MTRFGTEESRVLPAYLPTGLPDYTEWCADGTQANMILMYIKPPQRFPSVDPALLRRSSFRTI